MSEPPSLPRREILETVGRYYSERLAKFGPTHRGVDWKSADSQELRFSRLAQIFEESDANEERSLIDYGCGYGALLDHLRAAGRRVDYHGFDISESMIEAAKTRHAGTDRSTFTTD